MLIPTPSPLRILFPALLLLLTACGGGGGAVFVPEPPPAAGISVEGDTALGAVILGFPAGEESGALRNVGDEPLTIERIEVGGRDADDFSWAGPALPRVLGVGEALDVTWSFLPTAVGPREASVEVRSSTPDTANAPLTIDLSGLGVEPGPIGFLDSTQAAGIDAVHQGGSRIGQAWGDVNGDGWLDLFVTKSFGRDLLYLNDGDGTFTDSGQVFREETSSGAVFGDYDNDGWIDLYVTSHGATNVLYRNQNGTLVDVTDAAGVGDAGRGKAGAFADYDGDGLLDLYVANYDNDRPDVLYHNDGGGVFSVATDALDTAPIGHALAVAFLDYDNDGDLDLYVVNDRRGTTDPQPWFLRNLLYRNDGAGPGGWSFAEVAEAAGADVSIDGSGIAVGDYDWDGDLDLYMTDVDTQVFLENQGDGTFTDESVSTGTGFAANGWGVVFADFDLDGWLDLYLDTSDATGNRVFHNLGDKTFEDVTEKSGANDLGRSLGVASADYDRDGDVDLVVGNSGTDYRLYRNIADPGSDRWVGVRLEGGGPVNRSAIGSRVTLVLDDGRIMMQEVKSGSSLGSGNDLALRFGLGGASPVSLTVRWPDGTVEARDTVPTGTEIAWTYP